MQYEATSRPTYIQLGANAERGAEVGGSDDEEEPTGWKFTLKTTAAIFQLSWKWLMMFLRNAPGLDLRLVGCYTPLPQPHLPPPWEKVSQDTVGWNAG